jgi:DNA-binding transcriptional MerR regulator
MADDPRQPGFLDGKDAGALRTIGEVGTALGIKQHVLRYWEAQFPMLKPLKRSGGRRYYRPKDVELVATIDRLVNREGYTLKGARLALQRGPAAAAAQAVPDLTLAAPAAAPSVPPVDIVPQLRAIRERLAAALAA